MPDRSHESWHDPAIAEYCKSCWQRESEVKYRKEMASFLAKNIEPSMTVLDVGCGTGLFYKEVVPSVVGSDKYLGIDIAQPMLDIARHDFPDGKFYLGDLYGLAFSDDSFDTVLCFEVLGHLPEIEVPIAEMLRVARQLAIFSVWPSEAEIKEDTEVAVGYTVPHRSYPDAFIRNQVLASGKTIIGVEHFATARIYVIDAS